MPIAVDSSVLLAMGDGDEVSIEVNRRLQNLHYDVFCTNTPLVELGAAILDKTELAKVAEKALQKRLTAWRIRDLIIDGVKSGIAENIANELLKLFSTLDYHSALVVAEAAVCEDIQMLLTWEPKLLRIDGATLTLFLKDRNVSPVSIISPSKILISLNKLSNKNLGSDSD
jgi:hypothetical protein